MKKKNSISKLISYMSKYKIQLLFMAVCAILGSVFTVIAPKVLGQATTTVFEGISQVFAGTGAMDFAKLVRFLMLTLGLYAVSALFQYIQGFVLTGISNKVSVDLRKQLSEKIDRLPMKYLENGSTGNVQSIITNDVDNVQMGITSSFTQMITSVVTMVGVVVMMLTINVWMTLFSVLILPLSMLLIKYITKHSLTYYRGQMEHLGKINGQIEENLSGQSIISAYNQEHEVMAEFKKENELLYESGWKSQFYSGLISPITSFLGNVGYVGIAVLGGVLVIYRAIAVGDIQAFFQYIKSFTTPMQSVAQVMTMLQGAVASAERIFDFLEAPEEIEDVLSPKEIGAGSESISFQNIGFGYDPEQTIIHDFSVDVKQGQKIAIVGPTGAGKSTIIKLLMRFYDVQTGEIKINGTNIKEYRRDDLRSMIGMVLQDVWLFQGTILENIRYGNLGATDEEVMRAAKEAHAHKFIMQQPDGYDTVIGEEADNLSQGQKQLITIARAILADKKVLILDEATSSVDTRTEALIQKAMDQLMKGKTTFVIAHRLYTIMDADCILVMKDGDVVELGTHEELLEQGGFYKELFESQFKKSA